MTVDSYTRSCSLADGEGTGGKIYQFDAAFGPEATTEIVYEQVGSYVVEAVLEGYNGTVFAYGQTGCGKSHTMHGFIERALEHLFEATSTASSDTRYLALLTYLEIYNEKLRDLLDEVTTDSIGNVENHLQLKVYNKLFYEENKNVGINSSLIFFFFFYRKIRYVVLTLLVVYAR